MNTTVYDLWWAQVVRGVSAVAFGLLLLVWPAATIALVAIAFASLFAVYGILDIITAVQGFGKNFSAFLRLLLGVLEIGIVIYLFQNAGSGLTLATMGLVMAIGLVVLAITLIGSAFMSDVSAAYRWAVGIMGVVTLFVGITVARAPAVSIVTVIYTLGLFGLLVGPVEIASGLILRRDEKIAAVK